MRELLLLNLAGFRCAVRKEDILSYDQQNIHWLTDNNGPVTAIAMMGAHPLSLADLSCCLGLAPIRRAGKYPVLVPANHDIAVCFVVEQETGQVQVPAAAAFTLPAYLRTPFIDSCVHLAGELIPLINIRAILRSVSEPGYTPPAPSLRLPDVQEKRSLSPAAFRIFICNKKSFAAAEEYFSSEQAHPPGVLGSLPLLPEFVRGITLHSDQILTVLDLRRYLRLSAETNKGEEKWLIGSVAGQGFSFVVDADQGILSADAVTLASLPVLIQSYWRRKALLHARKIMSVLDFRGLLAQQPDKRALPALSPTLRPDRYFESLFGRQKVEITEFSLCGMIHALPAVEVADTLPFTHCQRLTGLRGLVAGVTLYKNKLLPVIDLARCFGRKSHPDPTWKLLLICNGDLRALVLAEELHGKRSLSLSEQRTLPFTVPYSSVYGCYPVSGRVGLIFNTLALTVYFHDEQADDLFFFSDELLPGIKNIGADSSEPFVLSEDMESKASCETDSKNYAHALDLKKNVSVQFAEEADSSLQSVVAAMLSPRENEAKDADDRITLKEDSIFGIQELAPDSEIFEESEGSLSRKKNVRTGVIREKIMLLYLLYRAKQKRQRIPIHLFTFRLSS